MAMSRLEFFKRLGIGGVTLSLINKSMGKEEPAKPIELPKKEFNFGDGKNVYACSGSYGITGQLTSYHSSGYFYF